MNQVLMNRNISLSKLTFFIFKHACKALQFCQKEYELPIPALKTKRNLYIK